MRWLAICLTAAFVFVAPAVAMVVQPMVIDLVPGTRQGAALVTVQNTFNHPLTVEVLVNEADMTETGLRSTNRAANEILTFPPQAFIPPGQTQTFRVQWVGDVVPTTSRHFFVTIAQLPVQFPEGESAIQLLYNFDIAVNVAVPHLDPQISVATSEVWTNPQDARVRPRITFRNASDTYGYVSDGRVRVTYTAPDGSVTERLFTQGEIRDALGLGLVAAHASRTLVLPMNLAAGGTVGAVFIPPR